MEKIQAPKGTRDIFGLETILWHRLEKTVRETARDFYFGEIRTPIFEYTDLFARSIGEETDIVQKEMYTFLDRAGRSLTLRPEGTAPVMRAYIEHGYHVSHPRLKWYYMGPMFRYEKPQAGRMRQFHQFGFESIGFLSPGSDAEIISLSWLIYQKLGFRRLTLEINSLGCPECKETYHRTLSDYLHRQHFCPTCRMRADRNPLRVLDCKDPTCREQLLVPDFPTIQQALCPVCRNHQEALFGLLEAVAIPFTVNPLLVRGLDYYLRTAFEIKTKALGAQDAVGGGGRYDNLSNSLGISGIPGVGFAAGMERVVLLLEQQEQASVPGNNPRLYLAPLDLAGEKALLNAAMELNRHSIPVYLDFADKGIKQHLKRAQKMNIGLILIAGELEVRNRRYALKNLMTGKQVPCDLATVIKLCQGATEDDEIT
ncbi:MAG TPA: histidine--tRNA ligase [Atribacteraceae bacterium]|nr:histidine--tRNA ligase [Atribacteraceae bacterium]